jgi:hypothetical protein
MQSGIRGDVIIGAKSLIWRSAPAFHPQPPGQESDMTNTLKFIAATSLVSLLNACTWVQLSSAGEGVEIRTAAQVANCQRLGVASSTTMDRLLVVDRNSERQQEELYILARNEAGSMGGNAVVPVTNVTNGRQRFEVYSCPDNSANR